MSTPVPSAILAGLQPAPIRVGQAGDLAAELVRLPALPADEPENYITLP